MTHIKSGYALSFFIRMSSILAKQRFATVCILSELCNLNK